MRKLTELYRILYEHVKDVPDGTYTGMCSLISDVESKDIITTKEWVILRNHIYKNKPTEWKHVEFIANKDYLGDDEDSLYWWPKGEWQQRKLFLKKMIQYSKPWYKQIPYLWNQLRSIERI